METKKQKIVSAVATMGIVLMLFGATYAYFASRVDAGKITDVEITANTVDVLTFEIGEPISLSLDQESFAEGKGDKSGSTFAKATLTPNNKTNTATDNYNVYLNISNNTFDYSLGSDKPEILLQVTDADGATVTSLDGQTYLTVTNGNGESVSGFDVTTKIGLITIANNKEITANTDTKEETWNVKVVFVNYNEDQSDNAGNIFNAKLMIQKEKLTLTDYVVAQYTGTQGDNNLYYHDSTLANGARDNSYRYAGGDYKLSGKAKSEKFSDIQKLESISSVALIGALCDGTGMDFGDYCSSSVSYYLRYDSSNTKYSSYAEVEEQALSDGYLKKNNVNNFVCFGSKEETCSDDNLYRIIGVFGDQVKLIKWDYATNSLLGTDGDYFGTGAYAYKGSEKIMYGYYWNKANYSTSYNATGYYNDWSYSQLNTVNLNTNFLNNIGTTWANKIASTTWKVGGTNDDIGISVAATAYTNEITSASTQVASTYNSKIGLMYVSDYGFAASPSAWTSTLENYGSYINENWMYMGLYEWTMTRSSLSESVYYINFLGKLFVGSGVNVSNSTFLVRPVFYLESSITYESGSGTKSDPIRLG